MSIHDMKVTHVMRKKDTHLLWFHVVLSSNFCVNRQKRTSKWNTSSSWSGGTERCRRNHKIWLTWLRRSSTGVTARGRGTRPSSSTASKTCSHRKWLPDRTRGHSSPVRKDSDVSYWTGLCADLLGFLEVEEPLYEPGVNTWFQSVAAVLRVFMFPRVPSATAPPVQGSSVPCGTLWTTLRRRRWWMFSKWSRLYVRRDSAWSPVW